MGQRRFQKQIRTGAMHVGEARERIRAVRLHAHRHQEILGGHGQQRCQPPALGHDRACHEPQAGQALEVVIERRQRPRTLRVQDLLGQPVFVRIGQGECLEGRQDRRSELTEPHPGAWTFDAQAALAVFLERDPVPPAQHQRCGQRRSLPAVSEAIWEVRY